MNPTLVGVVVALAVPMTATRSRERYSPLQEMEHQLFPWVSLGVVPVFAFFNSGIALSLSTGATLSSFVSLGIVLGLFAGKPLGIAGALWLAVKLKLAKLPEAADWRQVFGVAWVAGIGFTMSLFIAGLAFLEPAMFHSARLSAIIGSLLSAAGGTIVLWSVSRRRLKSASKQAAPFP